MSEKFLTLVCMAAFGVFAVGCQSQSQPATPETVSTPAQDETDGHQHDGDAEEDHGEADVAAAMATLSDEDREEAEAQKFCVVMKTSLLGSMGAPLKLDINGQPVFVCCAGCKFKAMKNPEQTLATVAKMKADNAAAEK